MYDAQIGHFRIMLTLSGIVPRAEQINLPRAGMLAKRPFLHDEHKMILPS